MPRLSLCLPFVMFACMLSWSAQALEISAAEQADLAPTGVLRIGINIGNMLLTGIEESTGRHRGIVFDLADELGRQAGLPIEIIAYDSAGSLAESVQAQRWDVAFLGIEPERAAGITFSAPYAQIDSTYLVPADSKLNTIADVDSPGVRIAISGRSAYDLVLSRTLRHASLQRVNGAPGVPGVEGAYHLFVTDKLEALAALRPVLLDYAERTPGYRVLDGRISTVYQAIGTPNQRTSGYQFLQRFIADIKRSGLVAQTIAKHGKHGIAVAQQP